MDAAVLKGFDMAYALKATTANLLRCSQPNASVIRPQMTLIGADGVDESIANESTRRMQHVTGLFDILRRDGAEQ